MRDQKYQTEALIESQINEGVVSSSVSELLQKAGFTYREDGMFLICGEILQYPGWHLHLSVPPYDLLKTLRIVLEKIEGKHATLRVIKDIECAFLLLSGGVDYRISARMVTIYPSTLADCQDIARSLVLELKGIVGSPVPMAVSLGGPIYAQLTSTERFDVKQWPFDSLVPNPVLSTRKFVGRKYMITGTVMAAAKGNVYAGAYMKWIFFRRDCLIKEGRKMACLDRHKRDIADRLHWQFRIHRKMEDHVSIPRVIELLKDGDETYLIMDLIKGQSVSRLIKDSYEGKCWGELEIAKKLFLIDCFLQALNIVDMIHRQGIIHRDLTPANFIREPSGKMWVVDLELSYDITEKYPSPPFGLGTAGYMSQEQLRGEKPTAAEDIYALGGFMAYLFTGITPSRIDEKSTIPRYEKLDEVIADEYIVKLIRDCLSEAPENRPSIMRIANTVEKMKQRLSIRLEE